MSYNNGPTIVRDGLVLYYDPASSKSYVSGSTTIYDLSLTGNTASLVGGVVYTGSSQGVFNFDGVNDYISFARPSSIVTSGSLTVSMYAKWETVGTTTSTIQSLIDNNHSSSPLQGFVIQDRPDLNKKLTFSVRPDTNGATSSFTPGHSSWYNITGTHDGTISRLYINGVLDGVSSQSNGVSTVQSDITLGRWQGSGGSRHLTGSIGQVLLYNRALTGNEVRQNYDATKGRYTGLYLLEKEGFSPTTQSWTLGASHTISDKLYSPPSSGTSFFSFRTSVQGGLWMYCIFYTGAIDGGFNPDNIASLTDSSGNIIAGIGYNRLGVRTFHVSNGTQFASITTAIDQVNYHLWLNCGADGNIRGWVSTTSTRPATFSTIARSSSNPMSRFAARANAQNQNWDNIVISTQELGNNPF